jgi:hypothetical protein
MALTNDEVLRCKAECGFNTVGIGAEAYGGLDGYVALFDRAIQPYMIDLSTTSATCVVANSSSAVQFLTLASNPTAPGNNVQALAFAQGSNISVDVGPNAETSVIMAINGLVITCPLVNAHGSYGPYPVRYRGAEQFVRDIFARIDVINGQLAGSAVLSGGIAQVDEVKLYAAQGGRRGSTMDRHQSLVFQRLQARHDLCLLLGIPYLPDVRQSTGGGSYEAY